MPTVSGATPWKSETVPGRIQWRIEKKKHKNTELIPGLVNVYIAIENGDLMGFNGI